MNDKPSITAKSDKPDAAAVRHGILPGVVHLALDVADKGQSTVFSVLHDARGELRTAVESGLDLAEKLSAAALRFSRKAVQRFDEVGGEALTGAERLIGGAVKSARETTNAAAQLATTAVSGVTAAA
jgi:hypothetical protein